MFVILVKCLIFLGPWSVRMMNMKALVVITTNLGFKHLFMTYTIPICTFFSFKLSKVINFMDIAD